MVLSALDFSNRKRWADWRARVETEDTLEIRLGIEDWPKLRPLFRDADWLLRVGGTLTLSCPTELRAACEWDWWTLGAQRFTPDLNGDSLRLTKRARRLDAEADPGAWTIAVISGGGNEPRLERIFASVARQEIPRFEVLVVGPAPKMILPEFVRHVPFAESETDPRFPITRKKNLVAEQARHENLLLLHDRFRCGAAWYAQAKELRPDWDVLAMGMTFEGFPDSRLADWSSFAGGTAASLLAERVARYDEVFPFNYRQLRVRQMSYADSSPFVTVNGGAFAVKRHVLRAVPLNPALHWAEVEDSDWSRQLHLRGKVVSLAAECTVESISDGRHSSASGSIAGWLATRENVGTLFVRVRELGFRIVQRWIDRLNRRRDFFTQRGFFARRSVTLTAPGEAELRQVDWAQVDVLYLRGIAERGRELRALFRALKAVVPRGREVHFELATTGFTFFRRSGHVRNCESLCYEIGAYLGRDFECRFVLSTLQHNFVLGFRRTSELQCYPLARVRVIGASEMRPAQAFVAALGAILVDAKMGAADAVLIVGDASALTAPDRWREAYAQHGAVCFAAPSARVLDGALLLAASEHERVANGWLLDGTPACRQVYESALIFAGIHPYNLRTTGGY